MTSADWLSVLHLATTWKLEDLRNRAIREIQPIDIPPLTQTSLGATYKIPQWLIDGYKRLSMRDKMLSDAEGMELGGLRTARISRLRERYWGSTSKKSTQKLRRQPPLDEDIRSLFADEIALAERGQKDGQPDAIWSPRRYSDDQLEPTPLTNLQYTKNTKFYLESIIFQVISFLRYSQDC